MRKSILGLIVMAIFCFPGMSSAWFDPHGGWEFEGDGEAIRNSYIYDLQVQGDLRVQTDFWGSEVTAYDVWVTLHSPRLNIHFWEFSAGTVHRIKVPDDPPTWNTPFRLDPITKDGLTYEVEFTSSTSGTIWIYGYVGEGVHIESLSIVLKTDRHSFRDESGCNSGIGVFGLILPLVLLLKKKHLSRRF